MNIEIVKPIDCKVVVNHHVELTEEEKLEARQQAIKRAEDEGYAKMKQQRERATRQRVLKEIEYFGIITTCDGFQVMRYFHINVYRKADEQARYNCSEVVQRWLSPNGKEAIVARLRGMSIMYYDIWNFS